MINTSEHYLIITLLLMSIVTACKPHEASLQPNQITVQALPKFHFTQQLPRALQEQKQAQRVTFAQTALDAIRLQATLVGDHRQQGIITNPQGRMATLKPGAVVGKSHWHVKHITPKQVILEQTQGEQHVLQLSQPH